MDLLLKTLEQYLLENFDRDDALICRGISPSEQPKQVSSQPLPSFKIKPIAPPKEAALPPPQVKPHIEKPKIASPPKETRAAVKQVDLFSIYAKIAPYLTLHKHPPSDQLAKHIKLAWKDQKNLPPIPIFVSKNQRGFFPLLSNLAQAISISFAKSSLYDISDLEKENRYENLFTNEIVKLILVSETLLKQSPHLLAHYKEIPSKKIKFIGKFRILLLPNLERFYSDPGLKPLLWKTLSQVVKELL